MRRGLPFLLSVSVLLVGCQTSTPQATADVKKQLMGRKPTQEEMRKAMGDANARLQKSRESGGK